MKYRKLRIAWSVAWGVVAVVLIVLWVRSFYRCDSFRFGRDHLVTSLDGRLVFGGQFFISHTSVVVRTKSFAWYVNFNRFFDTGVSQLGRAAAIPTWLPALALLMTAATPWIQWRYSLRTLLIGMTVAAIGLGWIVYAMRN